MVFNIFSSETNKKISTLFHKRIEKSGFFEVEMRENKLFGFHVNLQTEADHVRLSQFVLIGSKKLPLSFENADYEEELDKVITDDASSVDLKINQEYTSIKFKDVSLPRAKRVYHLTPFVIFCFLPLLWHFLPVCRRKNIKYSFLLFLPLFLLVLQKYFAFQHSYTLYYQTVSLVNLWHLEQYEFMIFASVYALLGGALYFPWRWIRIISVIGLIVLMIVLTIDGVVLHNLNARFIFSEAKNYTSEYKTAFYMLLSYLGTMQGRLMILCWLSVWGIFYYRCFLLTFYHRIIIWGMVIFFGIFAFWCRQSFLYDYAFYNVFDANQGAEQKRLYSADFVTQLQQSFDLKENCVKGLNKRKNVIVILAESLSTFSSQKLSGLHNYMPRLDKLMDKYAVYPQYYSNSYYTVGGVFSLISGMPPINGFEGMNIGSSYQPFYDNSVAQRLNQADYKTYFFTAVEPDKTLSDVIYQSHFDEVSDYRDSYYRGKPKLFFNAVADEYLFVNVLQRIENYHERSPYLMVVSTISGHGPYLDPRTKKPSFEKTTDYVDAEIEKFVNQLEKQGFFENGMVLITGDHRAMLPVSAEEDERLSPLAEGRVPLVVIDKEIRGEKTNIYSHNDIAPSLQYYLTDKGCFNAFQNNLFNDTSRYTCMLYQKPSPRNKVAVVCASGMSVICLNGDDTGYCEGNNEQKYVEFINYLRLQSSVQK
ncbi:MAG: sulfatase-like hydrolase/transferase [Alphaproteobacteria bacterium]|nr:sulfatase-like hydrolase/transferase [Alphaproteobacteria bacterium]